MGSQVHITVVQDNFSHKSSLTTPTTTTTISINLAVGDAHLANGSPLHRRFPEAIFVGFPIAAALTVLTLLYKDSDNAGGRTMLLNIFSSFILMLFCFASAAMTFGCKYPKIAATCGSITILITFFAFASLGCMILPEGWWWMAWLFSAFPLLAFILGPCELLLRHVGRKVLQWLRSESNITEMDFELQDFSSESNLLSMSRSPLHQTGATQMDFDHLLALEDNSRLLRHIGWKEPWLLWRRFSMPQMDFDLQAVYGGSNLLQKISLPLWSPFNIPQLDFDLQVLEGRRHLLRMLPRSISQLMWHQSNINPLYLDFQMYDVVAGPSELQGVTGCNF